ncbi:MAG: hypothetical protein WCR67_06580 [Bacilli bacterium]
MNFNLKENFQKKTIGFYLGLIAAVLGLVSLIIFAVYSTKNNGTSGWVYAALILAILVEISLFFLNEKISDIVAIAAPILYFVALGEELHTGVGNIVDSFQGIVMFGNASLASTNIMLAILLGIAGLISIVGCFLKKEKDTVQA